MTSSIPRILVAATALAASACTPRGDPPGTPMAGVSFGSGGSPSPLAAHCEPDNGGIILPDGFCAILVATDIPGARHLAVAPNGDVFVARRNRGSEPDNRGGVTVLRDRDGDGRADETSSWGTNGGNDVLLTARYVYHATNDAVLRYPYAPGALTPSGPPDTIVLGLRDTLNHAAKSIALGSGDALYVSIGAPGNACMQESRSAGSMGMDPCPLLETSGGIWKFDANGTRQSLDDGTRFATGLRNVMALGVHPATDVLFAVMHGRDQLHQLWPDLYTEEESAENPAEEFVMVTEGSNFGWPYCYQDARTGTKVLGPEYGGDGTTVGRCADMDMPIIGFPAHWAPNDLEFYTGDQFPDYFRGGIFVAFHGSWNRAPLPQDGYRVVFIPALDDTPGTEWHVFADGFVREGLLRERTYRPVGLATGPDGSLYVADSTQGRIWRIVYEGSSRPGR